MKVAGRNDNYAFLVCHAGCIHFMNCYFERFNEVWACNTHGTNDTMHKDFLFPERERPLGRSGVNAKIKKSI